MNNPLMELLAIYRRSLAEFTGRVSQVRDDQWKAPTPCEDWDVRTLVNHVVYEDRWALPLFQGATIAEVGDRFEGDVLGADPAGNAREAADEAVRELATPGALDRTVHLSFGDAPISEYVNQLVAEHIVHGWDLATAIGADTRTDADVVRACAQWFASQEEAYRESGMIAPRVDLGSGAGELERLVAAFGRDPAWHPPS
ncbi:TIGR03086 family metal-binding protein [Micromonospora sp. CPCC 206061]|uniref:TIGR03086 family metal-binding protein n=1 Tax=Micromonospora sp. CPCC 206061 TaxID=3122410 RepID=UPI002FF17AE5